MFSWEANSYSTLIQFLMKLNFMQDKFSEEKGTVSSKVLINITKMGLL